MRLIKSIRIDGLRSIRALTRRDLSHLTALVGKNSSGKSNILRALNLFFNNEIEAGKPIDFERDIFQDGGGIRSRKRKTVRIELAFELPANFKFPKQLAGVRVQLGNTFTIARIWELDRQGRVVDRFEIPAPTGVDPQHAWSFLNLITYRYIPNRTVPTLVLKNESRSLAKSIQIRLKGNASATDLIEGLRKASEGLLKDASISFQTAGAPLSEPQLAAPADLGELLTISGFQARAILGNSVKDEDWGSGHQAFFLYQLLYVLDTHYSRFFGWKQATIWGVEEPESGLHRDLETQLAQRMRRWAEDLRSKMQIITTTHSPIFTMSADSGYWTSIDGGATVLAAESIPELVRDAEMKGVSGWTQPILSFPTSPVVLVEGKTDAEVLSHIASLDGVSNIRFMPLPELDPAIRSAGKSSITSYLKLHGGLINNRPKDAPLVVVFDWDVSNEELQAARTAYGTEGGSRVIRMNASYCDSKMTRSFAGIERFYPPAVITQAVNAGAFDAAIRPGRPISISKDELNKSKAPLVNAIKQVSDKTQLHVLLRVWADIKAATVGPA